MAENNILASAVTSASYNMVLQLLFWMLNCAFNAFVLRYISKDMMGVVNVRLTLLYMTVLFLAREGFRTACLSKSTDRRWPQTINLLWCTLPAGMMLAAVFGYVWMFLLGQPDPDALPHYWLAVVCFALSTVIELLAEPLFIVAQLLLFVRLKVLIQGISLAVRCVLTVVLIWIFPEWGLLTFSLAQVVFTSVYCLMYYAYLIYYIHSGLGGPDFPFKSVMDLLPRRLGDHQPLINWDQATLTWSFLKQSFLRQILCEGERYIMTFFHVLSFSEQGVHDVVISLGSLVASFVIFPIEDSIYLFFSQTLTRGKTDGDQPKVVVVLVTQVLEVVLKAMVLLGLTIVIFGFTYSRLLLDLYGGNILSSDTGPTLLRWYCFYVFLLAIRGIVGSFANATMSHHEVNRYNRKLFLLSLVFLCSSWYLARILGSVGLILAKSLNVMSRIAYSLLYMKNYYKSKQYGSPWRALFPSLPVVLAFTVILIITALSESMLCCGQGWFRRLLHIAVGGVCLLAGLAVTYLSERPLIAFAQDQYRKHKTKDKAL